MEQQKMHQSFAQTVIMKRLEIFNNVSNENDYIWLLQHTLRVLHIRVQNKTTGYTLSVLVTTTTYFMRKEKKYSACIIKVRNKGL